MNFTTDPRKLASAVSWAARRVPTRPDVPILAGILIECDLRNGPESVLFTGFDYEVSATATLVPSDFRGFEEGDRIVVSGRLLAEPVKSLPPKPVAIAVDDDQMTITCGSVEASLPLMEAQDYPSLPAAPGGESGPIGIVHAEDFAKELARVLPACDIAMAQSLAALTGVHFEFSAERITLAATNRYQLATNAVGWQRTPYGDLIAGSALVPGAVLAEVLKVCDYDGGLEIGLSDTSVSFNTGQRVIVSRLLDVKGFPNFASKIPSRTSSPTVIDVEEVTTALKRAAMVLDGAEPVELAFRESGLTMRAGSGKGRITAELDCDHTGDGVDLTVNPQYFATAIGSTGDRAELTIGSETKPILVTAPKDEDYVHVVMPIRKPS
jgi:DNA polymerase III subunit beta